MARRASDPEESILPSLRQGKDISMNAVVVLHCDPIYPKVKANPDESVDLLCRLHQG